MQMVQALRDVVFEVQDGEKVQLAKAWREDGQVAWEPLYGAGFSKSRNASPQPGLLRRYLLKRAYPSVLVASCGDRGAYCGFNSDTVEIRSFSDDVDGQGICLGNFLGLRPSQGVGALSFATRSLLLCTCQEQLVFVPLLGQKTPKFISALSLDNGDLRVFDSRPTQSSAGVLESLRLRDGVFDLLASSTHTAVAASRGGREVLVADVVSQSLVQRLCFPEEISCLDLSGDDVLAVGSGSTLYIRNLRTGEQTPYGASGRVRSVSFQKLSPQPLFQERTRPSAQQQHGPAHSFSRSLCSIAAQSLLEECRKSAELGFGIGRQLVFCVEDDICAFLLDVEEQQIKRVFDFSLNPQGFGGKILQLTWADAVLTIRAQESLLVTLLVNGNLTVIAALQNLTEHSNAVGGQTLLAGDPTTGLFAWSLM